MRGGEWGGVGKFFNTSGFLGLHKCRFNSQVATSVHNLSNVEKST